MTKQEKARISERRFMEHMRKHMKHPDREYMKNWMYHLFSGVALTTEYLRNAYKEILEYLAQDLSRVDPCLHSLQFHERENGNGVLVDTWLSLESDGTRPEYPIGKRYRLTLEEVQNLWLLVKE